MAIPVYVKHNITFREGSSQGRFDLTLGPKQTMGKAVESVLVSSQLPRGVLNVSLNPSQGTYTFDPVTKVGDGFQGPPKKYEESNDTRYRYRYRLIGIEYRVSDRYLIPVLSIGSILDTGIEYRIGTRYWYRVSIRYRE